MYNKIDYNNKTYFTDKIKNEVRESGWNSWHIEKFLYRYFRQWYSYWEKPISIVLYSKSLIFLSRVSQSVSSDRT